MAVLYVTALCSSHAMAQDDVLQSHIDGAVAALQQLDIQANSCLTSLQQGSDTTTDCAQFLAAIDGELLARYLEHCAALTAWREQFVSSAFASNQSAADAESNLRILVGTDYVCADNALQQRTEFVTAAFALLQQSRLSTSQENAGLNRRLNELQFDATLSAERRLLQDAVQQQQLQRERAVERQNLELQNELMRQQRSPQ